MTQSDQGILHIVATPIGNLKDMTFRAVEVLQQVALIAVEDTRHSRILLNHYSIHTPVISYYEHNRLARIPGILEKLQSGQDVAVITDAGTPGISDPAYKLIRAAIEAGIQITSVPGPTAAIAALAAGGLPTDRFSFEGFLPAKKGRRKRLKELSEKQETIVLYESPHRLVRTLTDLKTYLGNRPVVVGRELTKIHETFHRGTLEELMSYFTEKSPRGECVILVGKANENVYFT